jgi:predicted transcriptional regulator
MSLVSIRLPEMVLKRLEICSQQLHLSRVAYIRKSIEAMNQKVLRAERQKQLQTASQLVRETSLSVIREFEAVEHDPDL